MKTMKKSKVIVPALGLLLLSTAASITGTVAWFTANKSVTLTAGNFAVVSTTGDLKATTTAGFATQIKAGDGNENVIEQKQSTGSVTIEGVATNVDYTANLSDASVDHKSKKVYYPYNSGANVKAHQKESTDITFDGSGVVEDDFLRQTYRASETATTGIKKYSIMTWSYQFSFTPDAGSNVGLFLDFAADGGSSVTVASSGTYQESETWRTYKGFRIGFFTTDKATVWAANQTKAKSTYVSANGLTSAATSLTAYEDYAIISSDNRGVVPADGAVSKTNIATNTSYPNYLGNFGTPDATGVAKLDLVCVAWFEGSDENIRNTKAAIYDTVSSSMIFTAVNFSD